MASDVPVYFAPVSIVGQTQYGRRRNARLSRAGAPVDWELWRRQLAPPEAVVMRFEYQVGDTYFLYLTWVEPEQEDDSEYWDRP